MAVIGTWLSQSLRPSSFACEACARTTEHDREHRAYVPVALVWPLFVVRRSEGCRWTCKVCGHATWIKSRPADAPAWPLFYRAGYAFLAAALLAVWLGIKIKDTMDERGHRAREEAALAQIAPKLEQTVSAAAWEPLRFDAPSRANRDLLANAIGVAPRDIAAVELGTRQFAGDADPGGSVDVKVVIIRLLPSARISADTVDRALAAVRVPEHGISGDVIALSAAWPAIAGVWVEKNGRVERGHATTVRELGEIATALLRERIAKTR